MKKTTKPYTTAETLTHYTAVSTDSTVLTSLSDESYVKHREEGLQLDIPHMSSSAMSSHNAGRNGLPDLKQLPKSTKNPLVFTGIFTHAKTMTSEGYP